jgi:hypothetical protein
VAYYIFSVGFTAIQEWRPPTAPGNQPDHARASATTTTSQTTGTVPDTVVADATTDRDSFHGVRARVFEVRWSGESFEKDFPCFLPPPGSQLLRRSWQDRATSTVGLLYEKPPKCASTTLAGVNLRIARNQGRKRLSDLQSKNGTLALCDVRWSHGHPKENKRAGRYQHRDKARSFLWSALREPTKRSVSWYFFKHLSLDGHSYSDEDFQTFLLKQRDHFYLYYLNPRPYSFPLSSGGHGEQEDKNNGTVGDLGVAVVDELNHVMNEYDFLGIVERLDESLVVLRMLLGVPLSDVLYCSSKVHDGFFARAPGTRCYYLQPSFVSDPMRDFFRTSEEWRNKIASDVALYQAVNRSLDLTIDRLGRDRVGRELERFRQAQEVVRSRCQRMVQLPCSRSDRLALPVEETGCMVGDVGCGMECIDSVATDLGLW